MTYDLDNRSRFYTAQKVLFQPKHGETVQVGDQVKLTTNGFLYQYKITSVEKLNLAVECKIERINRKRV